MSNSRCKDETGGIISRRSAVGVLGAVGLAGLGGALSGCAGGSGVSAGEEASSSAEGVRSAWIYSPAGFTAGGVSVDVELKRTMEGSGLTKPPAAAESTVRVESVASADLHAEVTETFYRRGWTDGLPVVPPTEEAVTAMAKGTDRPRESVVATLGPQGGQATVEKIAANAVMAGCEPSYLPVVIAAVEAIGSDEFDLNSCGTTTGPNATMLIVNGPIAADLDVNAGSNALGRGWKANATIGRALHLIEQNVGGSWPGVSDLSSLGSPAEYSLMCAENEEANPWEPYAVEAGFESGANVVTVASAGGSQLILDIDVDDVGFLSRVASYVSARDRLNSDLLLVLTPATAKKLAGAGWDKDGIRSYVDEHARVHESCLAGRFANAGTDLPSGLGSGEEAVPDENGMVKLPFVSSLSIVVAGGIGEKNELVPLWSKPVSREIQVPAGWSELLQGE